MKSKCEIISVGKRRDGGTRYWCLRHRSDATAKYGVPAVKCRHADIKPPSKSETLVLDIANYRGGVALWGAVPPVYDTTRQPLDRGIHVHARKEIGSPKEIDASFRCVSLFDSRDVNKQAEIAELDAIYYMVSSIFGFSMSQVECARCGLPHLDKDWFSLHPHKRHLCAGCGQYFSDSKVGIGNPLIGAQILFDILPRPTLLSKKTLQINQRDFLGGIQIWGSNSSIFWTGDQPEEEGIHVHVYDRNGKDVIHDDTYEQVIIDGTSLDPSMVRTLMAQRSLPHICERLISMECPICKLAHFDSKHAGFSTKKVFQCLGCGTEFPSKGKLRNVISNPLIDILSKLAENAPRDPQIHRMGLLPETL